MNSLKFKDLYKWKLQEFHASMPLAASITYFRNKNKEY